MKTRSKHAEGGNMYIPAEELAALQDGTLDQLLLKRKITGEISTQAIGSVNLPSGAIVAVDPLTMWGGEDAFTRHVQPGNYPVELTILKNGDWGNRNAFATIKFTDTQAIKFEMALVAGNDVRTLTGDEFFGYGVDAGTGSFMSAETAAIWMKQIDGDDELPDSVIGALDEGAGPTEWVNFTIPGTKNSFVVFESGYGDGSYASFWGLDAAGNVASLTTDFGLLQMDEDDETDVEDTHVQADDTAVQMAPDASNKPQTRSMIKHLLSIKEPATRLEYWCAVPVSVIVIIISFLLIPEAYWGIAFALGVITYGLFLLVIVRRLVAIDWPRWLVFVFMFLPSLAPVWLIFFFILGLYQGRRNK